MAERKPANVQDWELLRRWFARSYGRMHLDLARPSITEKDGWITYHDRGGWLVNG